MVRRGNTPEEIINQLKEAETLLIQGDSVSTISKKIRISYHTYYQWRKGYRGLTVDQVNSLKELERENSRLRRLMADLFLDNAILKEAILMKSRTPDTR